MRVQAGGTIPETYTDGTTGTTTAGAWILPVRRGYVFECCDCGLKHVMDFRVHRGRVQFRAWRVVRSGAWRVARTGRLRRSSTVESAPVKRGVGGSNPPAAATRRRKRGAQG